MIFYTKIGLDDGSFYLLFNNLTGKFRTLDQTCLRLVTERETKKSPMEVEGSSKPMIATQQELVEAKVPLAYRDQCAHLLIPLNKCRQSEFYLPWKCEDQRHSYEKCEYELVMERMLQMQKVKQANKQGQGSSITLIPKTANA